MNAATVNAADAPAATLLNRVRSEFLEMPGLNLTPAQAARLWALDQATSDWILGELVDAGFLLRGRRGAYLLASVTP
jgi:lipid-binding SYLF domain-containing protein